MIGIIEGEELNINLDDAEIKLVFQLIDDRVQLGEGEGYSSKEMSALKSVYFKFMNARNKVKKSSKGR